MIKYLVINTNSVEESIKLGKSLGKVLGSGDLVALDGDLGAGKTHFAYGIGEGLGVQEQMSSPTYTILISYQGRMTFHHFDVYRIDRIEEMYDIGYEEFFYGDGVCVVEWASKVSELLPKEALAVQIFKGENDNRKFSFSGPARLIDALEGNI